VSVSEEHWEHENGDADEHGRQSCHDIKVSIHTVSKNQEGILLDLLVSFWHLDIHFFEKRLFPGVFEVWLSSDEVLQKWKDVLDLGERPEGVHVLNVNERLVHLLSCKYVSYFILILFRNKRFFMRSLWHRILKK
jgi:hypothetical protein